MQNRAVGKSQRFCKAISIYSWSSQDVGLEVFDVLTIFSLFWYRIYCFALLLPPLSFRFQNGSTPTISLRAVTFCYEINNYTNKHCGFFVASCIFWKKDLVGIPNFVNISIAIKFMVVLPVGITRKETSYKGDYWICIPTIFGNIRVADVVEFLEMSYLLGASYFTFYDYNISDSARKMFS